MFASCCSNSDKLRWYEPQRLTCDFALFCPNLTNGQLSPKRIILIIIIIIIIVIIITLFKSQWIKLSILALLIEETRSHTESRQIKSNAGFSGEWKTRVPGEKPL